MDFFLENSASLVLAPFWVFLIIVFAKLFAVKLSKKTTVLITMLASLFSFAYGVLGYFRTCQYPNYVEDFVYKFIKLNELQVGFGVLLDHTSSIFLILIGFISLLVQYFSYFYMKNDKSFMRYFAYLNLFNCAMCGFAISSNLFQTYLFWGILGLSSYLLIGFWFNKPNASKAAKKAFIINYIGDFGFMLALIILMGTVYTFSNNYDLITIPYSRLNEVSALIYSSSSSFLFKLACLGLIIAALAKSAQFPLHTWLADAMEAPTPVSALIHSATMVASGVYLMIRMHYLLSFSSFSMNTILILGLITSLICAFFAITQTDVKRILAYSTSSQLGLMFFVFGLGGDDVAFWHLNIHAIAKALLFLVIGSIMLSFENQKDVNKLGGLRKILPICAICYLIGAVSLSGIAFSGYFSKEFIFAYISSNLIYYVLSLILSFMTSFYLFRAYFLIFEKDYKSILKYNQQSIYSKISIITLAIAVIGLSFFIPKLGGMLFAQISVAFDILGVVCAYLLYNTKLTCPKIPFVYRLSYNQGYFDLLYRIFIVRTFKLTAKIFNFIEEYLMNGLTKFVVFNTKLASFIFAKGQTGNVQYYLTYSLIVIAIIFSILMFAYTIIMKLGV